MDDRIECAKCTRVVSGTERFLEGSANCPTQTRAEVIKRALGE